MYYNHKVFEKPNNNTKIWRCINFEKFKDIIDGRWLFFCRSDLFEDEFEGCYPKAQIEKPIFKPIDEQSKEIILKIREDVKKYTFINCWRMDEYESAEMWELHLNNKEGVAIQSTSNRLEQCFETEKHVYIGKVKYIDHETDRIPEHNILYPFIYKERIKYVREKEVRAVVMEWSTIGSNDTENILNKGKHIPINLEGLIEKIVVSPKASEQFYHLIKSISDKYRLKIEPSSL